MVVDDAVKVALEAHTLLSKRQPDPLGGEDKYNCAGPKVAHAHPARLKQ